jgi:hypothetical protein
VEASNGAVLDVICDPKLNIRPWDKTLLIRVTRGFLREGEYTELEGRLDKGLRAHAGGTLTIATSGGGERTGRSRSHYRRGRR